MTTLLWLLLFLVLANLFVFGVLPRIARGRKPRGSPKTGDDRATRLLTAMVPLEKELERVCGTSSKSARAEERRQEAFAESDSQFVELCRLYLESNASLRGEIRAFFDGRQALRSRLLDQVLTAAHEIDRGRGEAENAASLWRGLAAVSIEDNRLDYRDTFGALGELYLRAADAGLRPTGAFHEIGELSSEVPLDTGLQPMKAFLQSFEKSAFFAESVAPRLERSERSGNSDE